MNRQQLFENIKKKKSFLCIGLDTDIDLLPDGIARSADGMFEFNKQIIEATHHLCVAYKPNIAFYESLGSEGWETLKKTMEYIHKNCPGVFTIADAKRGDIGNTSKHYARTYFERMNFDSITVAPYMGGDSVKAFLGYPDKWVVLLALTSNEGAADFQMKEICSGTDKELLYQRVLKHSQKWGNADQMMYVIGATRSEMLTEIRKIVPDHFLLVPGIGAQGGSLEDVCKHGMNKQCGLLVNVSRSILYADDSTFFAVSAKSEAEKIQRKMEEILSGS
jgi:orotidine-5'-phosphate decarboxylase